MRTFTVYAYIPTSLLDASEQDEMIGAPSGVWVRVARLGAGSRAEAVRKAARQAWCRDDRAIRYRAEPADDSQRGLFE